MVTTQGNTVEFPENPANQVVFAGNPVNLGYPDNPVDSPLPRESISEPNLGYAGNPFIHFPYQVLFSILFKIRTIPALLSTQVKHELSF